VSVTNVVYSAIGVTVWSLGWYPVDQVREILADELASAAVTAASEGPPLRGWFGDAVVAAIAFALAHWRWVALVAVRNFAITFTAYSAWHALLYRAPSTTGGGGAELSHLRELNAALAKRGCLRDEGRPIVKFNPEYPPQESWAQQRRLTLMGSLVASALECVLVYLHASGAVAWCVKEGGCRHGKLGMLWPIADRTHKLVLAFEAGCRLFAPPPLTDRADLWLGSQPLRCADARESSTAPLFCASSSSSRTMSS
jgi:hypothetical protein